MEMTSPFSSALELANHVEGLFEQKGPVDTEAIRELLRVYSSSAENEKDWRQYCFPNDIHYTRNLIFGNDKFELMVLVWRASQETRIHDHAASRCWMAPLSGEITEALYIPHLAPGEEPSTDPTVCPDLIITEKSIHKVGDVGFIEDDIGLHKIGNRFHDRDTITLHLYSPPIRELTLFEPDRKVVTKRRPGFYSVGGKKT